MSCPHSGWLSVKYNRLLTHFPREIVKARLFARLKIKLDKTPGKVLRNYVSFAGRWKYASLCFLVFFPLQKHAANPDLQVSKAAMWQQWILSYCCCYILRWESVKDFIRTVQWVCLAHLCRVPVKARILHPGIPGWLEDGRVSGNCSEPQKSREVQSCSWETCTLLGNRALKKAQKFAECLS